jgi:heme exporter protein C
MLPRAIPIVLWPLLTVACAYSVLIEPSPRFRDPEAARILAFHLPWALVSMLGFVLVAVQSIGALRGRPGADARAVALAEVTTLYAVNTMVSGVIFSRVQWGAWWSWDPRQTSYGLVLLMLGAYFALRATVEDPDRRTRLAASYAILMALAGLFLTWVLPRIPAIETLHPTTTIARGEMSTQYRVAIWALMLPAVSLLFFWLYNIRRRVASLEAEGGDLVVPAKAPVIEEIKRAPETRAPQEC